VGLSDSLYNPQGEKIGERLNWQYASGSLFSKEGKRRLVFDFPKTPEPIFFGSLQMFCGGTRAEKRAWRKKTKGLDRIPGGMELRTEMDGQTRQLIADFSGPSPRDHLDFPAVGDIALRYYYGPPGKSLYRFSAPFIQDREQRDQGGTLCPQENSLVKATNYSLAYFTLKLETPIEKAEDGSLGMAIAYDKAGKRYRGSILPREGAKSEDWFKDLEFSLNVPIGEIETITIGEKPYEVWVKGVQVTPPGSEDETRKEMTEIARVFEIPDMKYDQLFTYDFEADPDKALRSLSLFRGYPFNHALRAISSENFKASLLNSSNNSIRPRSGCLKHRFLIGKMGSGWDFGGNGRNSMVWRSIIWPIQNCRVLSLSMEKVVKEPVPSRLRISSRNTLRNFRTIWFQRLKKPFQSWTHS
jgi:hypothetical protein